MLWVTAQVQEAVKLGVGADEGQTVGGLVGHRKLPGRLLASPAPCGRFAIFASCNNLADGGLVDLIARSQARVAPALRTKGAAFFSIDLHFVYRRPGDGEAIGLPFSFTVCGSPTFPAAFASELISDRVVRSIFMAVPAMRLLAGFFPPSDYRYAPACVFRHCNGFDMVGIDTKLIAAKVVPNQMGRDGFAYQVARHAMRLMGFPAMVKPSISAGRSGLPIPTVSRSANRNLCPKPRLIGFRKFHRRRP